MKINGNFWDKWLARMTWAPADDAGNGAGDPPAGDPPADPPAAGVGDPPADPTNTPAAGDPPAGEGAKWFEDTKLLDAEDRELLKSKGLTLDDPAAAAAKLAKIYRSAEKHIGRGVDKILERPADGESYSDWARKNAEALGLPKDLESYEVAKPEDWPSENPWDSDLETQAKKIAHEEGIPPGALNKFVALYAGKVAALNGDAESQYKAANEKMMGELEAEYGAKTPAIMARAQQVAHFAADKIGLDAEALQAVTGRLSKDMGDAQVIRFMNLFADAIGDDSAIGLGAGSGSGLGASKSDAQAKLAAFTSPDGEWAKASAKNDRVTIARLRPQFDQLTRAIAAFDK